MLSYIETQTQADTVIAFQSVNGNCNAAISNDGDFIVAGGKHILPVLNFHFHKLGIKQKKNIATMFGIFKKQILSIV